jgi:NADPH-dependent ferric siderophore reductase
LPIDKCVPIDEGPAEGHPRPMNTRSSLAAPLLDRMLVSATVADVAVLAPRLRRVRLHVPTAADLAWTPGQHVRVLLGDPVSWGAVRSGFRDLLRTYTVLDLDRPAGLLDLCVLDHGDGPGARWARTAAAGDEVSFLRPEGRLVPRDAGFHLFVGEETAQVPIAAIMRALPEGARVGGVVEVADAGDRLDFPRADELTWTYRGDAPAAGSPTLLAALRELDLPGEGVAYVAGEAKACSAVRRHLVLERGWPGRSVLTKPFWTPGKRGMD